MNRREEAELNDSRSDLNEVEEEAEEDKSEDGGGNLDELFCYFLIPVYDLSLKSVVYWNPIDLNVVKSTSIYTNLEMKEICALHAQIVLADYQRRSASA